jgi:hypothetical protein
MAMSYPNHRVNLEYEWARAEIGLDELARLFHANTWEKPISFDISKCSR